MMALDSENNLNTYPLKNIDLFIAQCLERGVAEVNVTGTNTDSLLYKHTSALTSYLRSKLPGVVLGARTNGAAHLENLSFYDKASVTVCSFDPVIYIKMMGKGSPAHLRVIKWDNPYLDLKVNVVLGPENIGEDLMNTLSILHKMGIKRVNVREPYGQPNVGDPLTNKLPLLEKTFGMSTYLMKDEFHSMKVTYWDVHYVEVESVNLYANGNVSMDYPITRGHDPVTGNVKDQTNFPGGRVREQWLTLRKKTVSRALEIG